MMRRYLPVLLTALLIMMSACTTPPPQRTLPTTPKPEQITLRVAVYYEGTDLDPVIEAYQATYADVRIEKVSFRAFPDMMKAVKDGQVDLFDARAVAADGSTIDLEPYIRKSGFDITPLGTLMEANREDGRIFSLPVYGNPYVLVYNKQLVADAGVTMPTDSMTWDQLREIAQKLTKGKGPSKQWGLALTVRPEYVAYAMVLELAGPGRPPEPDHVESALRYFRTLLFTDESLAPYNSNEPSPLYFDQGKAALSFMPLIRLMGTPPDKLPGIAPPPAHFGSKPVALLDMKSYAMAAGSANPDAAWAFLAFAAGPEGAMAMARAWYFPLYNTEAVHQTWLDRKPGPPAGTEPVLKATWFPVPHSYSMPSPFGIYMSAARDVLSGDTTVDLAMRLYRADMAALK